MALVNQNFRALRESRGLTQTAFAELFGLTRAKVESYEKDTEPRINTLVSVADFFSISLAQLVSDDLSADLLKSNTGKPSPDAQVDAQVGAQVDPETQNKPYLFSEPQHASGEVLESYMTGVSQRPPLVITVDSDERERITLVREEAYAGYLAGFADRDFVGTLPTFNIPSLTGRTFRAFQVRGDSMLTTLFPGDIVVCSYVDNWRYIRDGDVYVVVSQYDGIIVKRVTSKLAQEGPHLVCRSDNTSYKPLRVSAADISEVWRFEARISFQLANYSDSDYEGRLTTLEMLMADLIEERESRPTTRRLGPN